MTTPSGDEFTDKMWQHMQTVNNEATKMINTLRREVARLNGELGAAKDRYYELQEQNYAMQRELSSRGSQ